MNPSSAGLPTNSMSMNASLEDIMSLEVEVGQWSTESLASSSGNAHDNSFANRVCLQELEIQDADQWSIEASVTSMNDDEFRNAHLTNTESEPLHILSSSLSDRENVTVSSDDGLSRKRKRNFHKWTRNMKKEMKTRGKGYISTTGTVIPAKKLGPGCHCKKKCFEEYNLQMRTKMFEEFYNLDAESQRQYIASLVEDFPKKSTKVLDRRSRRNFTRKYYFSNCNGTKFEVCQRMFLSTFAITLKKLRIIVEKKRFSGVGILPNSQRGKHGMQKKISEESKNLIKMHINMFPCYESHYSRSHTQKKYLDCDLSVAKMYRLYIAYCNDNVLTPEKESYYRKVFVEDFNLAFKKPKNDTCGKCDKYKLQLQVEVNLEKINEIETEKNKHIKLYESSYAEKKKDIEKAKENGKVITISFDLEKCLPTLFIKSNFAFYKRKLWTLNLTAYKVSQLSREAFCFLWDETIASRGGQEIASCLFKLLKTLPEDLEEINLYSDNCTGQNKNIYVAVMFLHFINDGTNGPSVINHKFLEAGHTHMEADTIHASIEKERNRTAMKIELPKDWANLIRTVHRKPPINVFDMSQSEFYDFKKLLSSKYIHRTKNVENERMNWNDTKWMQFRKQNPGILFYKNTFDADEDFKKINFYRGRTRNFANSTIGIVPLHDTPIALSKQKVDDLQSFLDYLQPSSRPFYTTLKDGPITSNCVSDSEC